MMTRTLPTHNHIADIMLYRILIFPFNYLNYFSIEFFSNFFLFLVAMMILSKENEQEKLLPQRPSMQITVVRHEMMMVMQHQH